MAISLHSSYLLLCCQNVQTYDYLSRNHAKIYFFLFCTVKMVQDTQLLQTYSMSQMMCRWIMKYTIRNCTDLQDIVITLQQKA